MSSQEPASAQGWGRCQAGRHVPGPAAVLLWTSDIRGSSAVALILALQHQRPLWALPWCRGAQTAENIVGEQLGDH